MRQIRFVLAALIAAAWLHVADAKTPPPAPLTGTVSAQTWVSYDENFTGITLPSGKAFHFNVLPPAQYDGTNYMYPLYIWLHPQSEGSDWYSGNNTDATYLVDSSGYEAYSFNTTSFLTAYPAFIAVPYADQTTDTCGGCQENWGGWTNNGSTGSGTVSSGDTGPNTFALLQMITFLEGQYSIDPTRVYCNGFSLGGIGCEYLLQKYNAYTGSPAVFAAGMSEAGVVEINGYGSGPTTAQETAMTNVPVWWFSGSNDTNSYPSHWNEPMFKALSGGSTSYPTAITSASANRAGTSQMLYTECPTCGHQDTDASGNPVWTNTTMNNWLFSQSSGATAKTGSQIPLSAYIGNVGDPAKGSYPGFATQLTGFQNTFGRNLTYLTIFMDQTYAPDDANYNWNGQAGYYSSSIAGSTSTKNFIPIVAWPFGWTNTTTGVVTNDTANVANGTYDTLIQQALGTWKAAGFNTMVIRPAWEFNIGTPWAVTSSNLSTFLSAWKHFYTVVHTYAAANGMTINIEWYPNVGPNQNDATLTVAQQYPGNSYVDILAIDEYSSPVDPNWATHSPLMTTTDTTQYWLQTMLSMAVTDNKPVAFGEVGGTDQGFATDVVQAMQNRNPAVDFAIMGFWDIDDTNGNMSFTNSSDNQATLASIWTGGFGVNGSVINGESLAINTITSQTANTAFTVSGTIAGLTTAPTLQYSVNGGSWVSLQGGQERNPYNQPGGQGSPWNIPFGNQATWSSGTTAADQAICAPPGTTTPPCVGLINSPSNYGQTLYIGASGEGTYQFTTNNNGRSTSSLTDNGSTLQATIHLPNGAYAPGPYPGDNNMIMEDPINLPNRQYTFGGVQIQPPGVSPGQGPFTAASGEWDDITSNQYGDDADDGLSGYNVGDGMITGCDVTPSCNPFFPEIKHALRYSISAQQLQSNALNSTTTQLAPSGWPQNYEDGQTGINVYTGSLPAGSTLGIPLTTAMPSGLDSNCQGLFWTMQHYPLFWRDQAGAGLHLSADQVAYPSAYITSAQACLPQLVGLLRILTNQHQTGQSFTTNPANGPGARVDTGPYPLTASSSGVTANSFTFTVPGQPPGASNTIAVRDANNTSVTATSNNFQITGTTNGNYTSPSQEISYLNSIAGTGVVSGQFVEDGSDPTNGIAAIQTIQAQTGKWLGLIGGDYFHFGVSIANGAFTNNFTSVAANYWAAGGLVEVSLSMPNPTTGGGVNDTNVSAADLLTAGTATNNTLNSLLSEVATEFQSLQKSGVQILFRPLHEGNGTWFWWGSGSGGPLTQAQYVSLWKYIYNYMTVTAGLKNIIWVWAPNAGIDTTTINGMYPGSSYVDVVGWDLYTSNPASDTADYNALTSFGKPIAMTEFGPGSPSAGDTTFNEGTLVSALKSQFPKAVYWLQWWDGNGSSTGWGMAETSSWANVKTALTNSYVINRGTPSPVPPPSGGGSVTWNGATATSTVSLSSDKNTASSSSAVAGGVLATVGGSAGKYCFAATAGTISTNWTLGLADSAINLTSGGQLGYDTNAIGFYPVSPAQAIYFNGSQLASGTATDASGAEIDECVDLTAQLFWVTSPAMRGAGFTWNDSTTADPGTGAGGLSFSGMTCPCFPAWSEIDTPASATLNTAGPMAVSLPSGFAMWSALAPAVAKGSGPHVIILNENIPPALPPGVYLRPDTGVSDESRKRPT
jgi:mannan endo-1,4-beta-mannosidase